jgi:hypothetical protein
MFATTVVGVVCFFAVLVGGVGFGGGFFFDDDVLVLVLFDFFDFGVLILESSFLLLEFDFF